MSDSRLQHLISAIEQADSPGRLIGAVRALADQRSPEGIPTLIQVLGYNNPGAAVTAMNGLVQLGEVAVQPLIEQLDDYNYGARSYSIRALAAIGNARALDTLLEAAETDFAPSVRRAATKGIGFLKWDQIPVEQVGAAQTKALNTLLLVSQDPDWAIRYAAVVGLQALAQVDLSDRATILDRLNQMAQSDSTLATQARSRFAVQQLNAASSVPSR